MTNITVRTGDMFGSEAQTLVNTVNCVGVMGKGIALAFKERFPEMYKDYVARCKAGKVRLGEPYLYTQLVGPWVLNFPTKDHWRSVSKLSDIVEGLRYLEAHYWEEWRIASWPSRLSAADTASWNGASSGRPSTGALAASTSPSNSTRRTARPLSRWTRPSSPGRTRSRSRSGKA